MENTLPIYRDEKYTEFSGSLPDILAVKSGAKCVARLSCNSVKDYLHLKKVVASDNLKLIPSKYKILSGKNTHLTHNDPNNGICRINSAKPGTIYLYLSKNKESALRARELDPELKNHQSSAQGIKQFGELLSYPSCCVDKFIEMSGKPAPADLAAYFNNKISSPFYFNSFLHNISNYYLSFHYPCTFKCKATLKHNKDVFEGIQEVNPEFAQLLKTILKLPLLAVIDYTKKWPLCFDNRVIVLFNGTCNKKYTSYSGCVTLKTSYFPNEHNELKAQLAVFQKGNRVVFEKKNIILFKDNSLIKKFDKQELSNPTLMNFR